LDRWGWVEIAGHAYRTDFDLKAHTKGSGVDLSIFTPYPQPVEKQVTVVIPLDSVLGPILRDKSRPVLEALKVANPDEVKAAFERSGYYEVQGFKVLASHVRFEQRTIRETGRRFVPHVIEPSYGAERIVYSTLEYAYTRSKDRVVLKLPRKLAPVQMMVFPLMAKDGMPDVATSVTEFLLENHFDVEYDDAATIGRRYARADEIGVPITVTIDYETLKDDSVTLRDRDSWKQVRVKWKGIPEIVPTFLRGDVHFRELGSPVKVEYE